MAPRNRAAQDVTLINLRKLWRQVDRLTVAVKDLRRRLGLRGLGVVMACALWPVSAHAASCSSTSMGNGVTCVQSASTFDSTLSTTVVLTYPSNVTAGNFLVCAFAFANNGGRVLAGIVDSGAQAWTVDLTHDDAVTGTLTVGIARFYNTAALTGTHTVTMTLFPTSSLQKMLACAEYSGVATATAFDQSKVQDQASPTTAADNVTSTATSTTGQATELLIGAFAYYGTGTGVTAGTSFTLHESLHETDNGDWLFLESRTVSSTGTYAGTFTLATANSGTVTDICTYKLTAAGGATVSALMLKGM